MASYVIIGGGIAGASAAETIADRDPESEITLITDEGEPLYNRILIKEHAKGKLPEAPLSIHDEQWYEQRDIDLWLNTAVTNVDPDQQTVRTHTGDTIGYDRLLIASGGTPKSVPVPNADAEGIHHFWTLEDARRIKAHAEDADRAAVVGAGLIGIDFAAICGAHGVDAKYLMRGDCWWRYALSETGAEIIHNGLREIGVEPVFNSGVERFETDTDGSVSAVVTPDDRYPVDMIGVGIGLDYNTEFLDETDLEMDGEIIVDEYMQTSREEIYAAGDLTRYYDPLTGGHESNGSWDSAKAQGQIAGANMVESQTEQFEMVPTYSITHFEFPFLSVGHPTEGDRCIERRYDDQTYRRIALRNDRVIGGVLVGDLAPQNAIKTLIEERTVVAGDEGKLLAESIDLDRIKASAEH